MAHDDSRKFGSGKSGSGLKNNKSLGQHWLKDRFILDEIAELSLASEASRFENDSDSDTGSSSESNSGPAEACLEIGPGLGTLTSALLRVHPKVVAVEFDQRLAENLPKSFPGKNLEVINTDFLQFDLGQMPKGYVVAGNIPYYITSPIIRKLVEAENAPARIVLLVQKEVAERVAAGASVDGLGASGEDSGGASGEVYPGQQTLLSLLVQNRATVGLGPVVEKEYFTPPPKVDSQVLILMPHAPTVEEEVFRLIRVGFSSPRKKLLNNLQPVYGDLTTIFEELNLSLSARPGELGLQDWERLYRRVVADHI